MPAITSHTARSKSLPPETATGSANSVRVPAKYSASCAAARRSTGPGRAATSTGGPANRTAWTAVASAATPSGPIGDGTEIQSIPSSVAVSARPITLPRARHDHPNGRVVDGSPGDTTDCGMVLPSISGHSAPCRRAQAREAPDMTGLVVTFLAIGGFALLLLVLSLVGGHLHLGHIHLGHLHVGHFHGGHLHLGHGGAAGGQGNGAELTLPSIAGFLGAFGFAGAVGGSLAGGHGGGAVLVAIVVGLLAAVPT